jgi:hypothetical protein
MKGIAMQASLTSRLGHQAHADDVAGRHSLGASCSGEGAVRRAVCRQRGSSAGSQVRRRAPLMPGDKRVPKARKTA